MEILWGIMALVLVLAVVLATRRASGKAGSDADEETLGHPHKDDESWTLDSVEDTSESES